MSICMGNKPELPGLDRPDEGPRDLGLSTNDVISAMQAAFSGGRLAYFIMNGYQYYVIAQVERKDRNEPADISKVYVRNKNGDPIPLNAVLHVESNSSPSTLLTDFNRFIRRPPFPLRWRRARPSGMALWRCNVSRTNSSTPVSRRLCRGHRGIMRKAPPISSSPSGWRWC